jgi:DNA-directed RNA polymerase
LNINDNAGPATLGQRYFDALVDVKVDGKYIYRDAPKSDVTAVGKLLYNSLSKQFPQVTKTREMIGAFADAHEIAKKGSIEFMTPTGFNFKQDYRKKIEKVVEIPTASGGTMKMTVSELSDEVDWGKQRLGLAPNAVHSYDA